MFAGEFSLFIPFLLYSINFRSDTTYNKPRIISCADETDDYICLPRGCREDLSALLSSFDIATEFIDHTQKGKYIDVSFNGVLREEQTNALRQLSNSNTGVLCGTTAFGKTVVAINLIADKKVNTLILVDKISLLSQWEKRLQEFLTIRTSPQSNPDTGPKSRDRKKRSKTIGQIGAGKNTANGIIDIALIQSLNKSGEVVECIKQYGMIIVDECHHVSAVSFETVLKAATSKYVYGLTATPTRKNGHHPIIFMQCGSIQYRDDPKKQADKRPFSHFVIPRFTSLKIPDDKSSDNPTITTLYAEVLNNEFRNQMILSDIIKCHNEGRNCLILTERKAHVDLLFSKIRTVIPDVITLTGGKSISETRTLLKTISETPSNKLLTIIATGKFIGEGFDEPRLDTLFLTMPISWKGTLQQYAGRLHRLYDTKNEVRIFDYIDIHVKMLERMYQKRLNGYASIGYKVKGSINENTSPDYIFDKNSFLPVYRNDVINAVSDIMIVSPFIRKNRVLQVVDYWKNNLHQDVNMTIITRPINDFKDTEQPAINDTVSFLKMSGVTTLFKSNIHQKFAIIDDRVIWYGSINLLSFGNAEESIMRLENSFIAKELKESIQG
ncbi:MAG: DEAD/DEAH box helicase family protein [Fibrobacter sp.]|nr:DEAD/DEAH box helicase family protein [Fibrobacter sp.]